MATETLPRLLQDKIGWIAIELRGIVSPLGGGFRLRNVNSHLGEILSLVQEDEAVSVACEGVRTAAAHMYEVRQILRPQADFGTDKDIRGASERADAALLMLADALSKALPSLDASERSA
ncbi:hypothetical protein [Methylobacterium nigriterrae]|uniref:hypothetical protein n=1 Tax=Methylobacterium nigriterrae TaxID=3127512 RepID=UPI0030138AC6